MDQRRSQTGEADGRERGPASREMGRPQSPALSSHEAERLALVKLPETGVCELLATLPMQIQPHVSEEDSDFLQDMFADQSLLSLVKMHERLRRYEHRSPYPVTGSAAALAYELAADLQSNKENEEVQELLNLLAKPHVKSLLSVHDVVAKKGYDPALPPLPDDMDDEEDSVKIIQLVKNTEPLGATVKWDEQTRAIVVARVMRGGAADRSGLIHAGDELKEVNGVLMENKKPEDIIPIVAQSRGAITFKVVPGIKEVRPTLEPKMFVRALFDFDPNEDKAIPCKEAGLAFKKGDVLQIVSREEPAWWQAIHKGNGNTRAGLIPSQELQTRRLVLRRALARVQPLKTSNQRTYVDYGAISGIHIAGLRRSFRLSRRDRGVCQCECGGSGRYDTADVPTYEEVAPYRKQPGAPHRLVVLVGPRGVGLNELKRRLIISDPEQFSVAVPHTCRAKRSQETDGVEYNFVSKHHFEVDIINNKFIEHGEYKGNYYGISLDSVQSALAGNKVCLLDVPTHRIKPLRTKEFKPYVVFVKPPSLQRLQQSRRNVKVIYSQDEKGSAKLFSEEDFEEMIVSAQVMETQYGHLFDRVIVNDDLATAFRELRSALEKVESETQWVPRHWTLP
ncbi:MAGUK p55 subfamily member 7-like [Megalops cyprinoides]|uniref:MAGUK p55 subfamily member 7-like n=1 Tax=Megalops cyprinoides TaxID=118141 RepID=UPI001864A220|nr:MAGUK p55 subfamily member 7-like [Megalops cyprinoides]